METRKWSVDLVQDMEPTETVKILNEYQERVRKIPTEPFLLMKSVRRVVWLVFFLSFMLGVGLTALFVTLCLLPRLDAVYRIIVNGTRV